MMWLAKQSSALRNMCYKYDGAAHYSQIELQCQALSSTPQEAGSMPLMQHVLDLQFVDVVSHCLFSIAKIQEC